MKEIVPKSRMLSTSWWGKAWNKNLESYSDYSNRLPRARTYIRQGHVRSLEIEEGLIVAKVKGSRRRAYDIMVVIEPLEEKRYAKTVKIVNQRIENLEALIKGDFPKELEDILTDRKTGLFPAPSEIKFGCSCPDWAALCKHIGAVLYGVGVLLDDDPMLFFTLRGIDMKRLLEKSVEQKIEEMLLKAKKPGPRVLSKYDVERLFGI